MKYEVIFFYAVLLSLFNHLCTLTCVFYFTLLFYSVKSTEHSTCGYLTLNKLLLLLLLLLLVGSQDYCSFLYVKYIKIDNGPNYTLTVSRMT